MTRVPARHTQQINELESQLAAMRARAQRAQRALNVLGDISVACRGATSYRRIFEATYQGLRTIFNFDSCYIALCDRENIELFRAVLLVDEQVTEYKEQEPVSQLTGQLIRTHQPLLLPDLVEERARQQIIATPFGNTTRRSRAWLGVPLLVGQDAVGVISLQSYQAGVFDESDVELLQQVANVVAVALENAVLDQQQMSLSGALARQVAERTGELATLSAIAAELVLQQPLPMLLERALDLILPLFELEGGTVRRLEPRGDRLKLLAYRGFFPEYADVTTYIPVTGSAQGDVVHNNRPLAVADHLTPFALPPTGQPYPYVSLLSVPLRIGARVVGTLSLFGQQSHEFAQQTIDLAQAIGNQIAIAIENARLFEDQERRIHELRALSQLSQAASGAHDTMALLQATHAALRSVLPLDAFIMAVYDSASGTITDGLQVDRDGTHALAGQPPPAPLARVLQERPAQHRTADDHQSDSALPDAWLSVPLLDRDGTVSGALAVQVEAFDDRTEAFLGSVALHVALHLQNIQLWSQRERQIRELDAIGHIGQLITASYDFEEMLNGVYETLQAAVEFSVFYLIICEPTTQIVTNAIFIEQGERVPLGWVGQPFRAGSLSAWIINQREPLLFDDVANQRAPLTARGVTPIPIGPENQVRSWVGVPLLARGGDPIGVLSLQEYRPHRYDEQTIDFLTQVASHISLGVQKVRLFEERERQIEENARLFAAEQAAHRTADTLREVAQVLSSSFDTQEVLQLILRELHTVIPYDTASIMLVERDTLRIAAYRGFSEHTALVGMLMPMSHDSAATWVVSARRPMVIADTSNTPHWVATPHTAHVCSWLGVPLISRGSVVGVLNIDSCESHRFTNRDVEVAQAFASQAAVAMENARLYEESVARIEQELEIARRIQSNLFPRTLPRRERLALAARCVPARETGGDFYDVVELQAAGTASAGALLGLIVGDASGKSIQGAMLMAIARSIVRSEARDHQAPEVVMRETNAWIAHDVPPRSFVALCYATLDVEQGRLALANAGQLTPLCRRADGRIEYLDVPGPTLPLGIMPDTNYAVREFDLEPGDLLLFFTDGVVEARNFERQLFGFERFEALVARYATLPLDELINRMLDDVFAFMAGAPQHDDITIVAVRIE